MAESKQEKEREFHNRSFSDGSRRVVKPYYSVVHESRVAYEDRIFSSGQGADVLEFGCGEGASSVKLARRGARVIGIDVSDVAIEHAERQAVQEGVSVEYLRMDAEALEFPDASFDLVCGIAILHHLDLDKAYAGIARVLKPDGRAVFFEPLGHNPAINLYRHLTPHLRTEDEHPLLMQDLRTAAKYFERVENRFFTLQSLLAVPFRRTRFFMPLLNGLEAADRALFALCPPIRRLAWQVVIVLARPRQTIV